MPELSSESSDEEETVVVDSPPVEEFRRRSAVSRRVSDSEPRPAKRAKEATTDQQVKLVFFSFVATSITCSNAVQNKM